MSQTQGTPSQLPGKAQQEAATSLETRLVWWCAPNPYLKDWQPLVDTPYEQGAEFRLAIVRKAGDDKNLPEDAHGPLELDEMCEKTYCNWAHDNIFRSMLKSYLANEDFGGQKKADEEVHVATVSAYFDALERWQGSEVGDDHKALLEACRAMNGEPGALLLHLSYIDLRHHCKNEGKGWIIHHLPKLVKGMEDLLARYHYDKGAGLVKVLKVIDDQGAGDLKIASRLRVLAGRMEAFQDLATELGRARP